MDEDPSDGFRLMPGDIVTLRMIAAETSELEGIIVDEAGQVHVPLAGGVDVGGLSLAEAEQRVEEAMRPYDSVVRVNVVVTDPSGHQATVLGAVSEPGRVPLHPGTRVADLVALAGGPVVPEQQDANAPIADLDGARVIRNGEALPVSISLAMQGDPRHNVHARAGDHLYVPPTRGTAIIVLGEVAEPRMLAYYDGIRLTQALALTGGLAPDGHRKDIRVVRGPLREPAVYHVSLKALVEGDGTDVELAAGDIVYVTRTGVANIRDALNAISPLLSIGQTAILSVGIAR